MKQPDHSHHQMIFTQSADGAAMVTWLDAGRLKGIYQEVSLDGKPSGWKKQPKQGNIQQLTKEI